MHRRALKRLHTYLYKNLNGSCRTHTSMSLSNTAQPSCRNFLMMPNLSAEMAWLDPVSAWLLLTYVYTEQQQQKGPHTQLVTEVGGAHTIGWQQRTGGCLSNSIIPKPQLNSSRPKP